MSDEPTKGYCFVISPIGKSGSEDRVRSDQVLKHIVTPAVQVCGYEAIRADKISEPGMITSQVIQHIVDDPLVVADLTGHNPNVFYELALRHALRKPMVQIILEGQTIPFDVAAARTIMYDHTNLDSAERAKEEITKQVKALEANPDLLDTPISAAVELQSLRQSDNPLEKSAAEILTALQQLQADVSRLTRRQDIAYSFNDWLLNRTPGVDDRAESAILWELMRNEGFRESQNTDHTSRLGNLYIRQNRRGRTTEEQHPPEPEPKKSGHGEDDTE